MQEQQATESDLKSLNRFTLRELKEEEVFIFAAKFIDSEPTSNGRIWSREWMEAAVERKLFDGIPFLTNHENDQARKIGTVISAELKDDGIHGRVFIPLDDQGKQSKEAVENGRIRNISLNADGESKREGDLTRILPSDDMRVFEVWAVAVGGCKSCVITEQSQGGAFESDNSQSSMETLMLEFGRSEFETLKDEFVRNAGFALGTGINRELYRRVAESLDPLTLRRVSKDLRESYDRSQHENQDIEKENGSIEEEIKRSLQNINRIKGV